MAGNIERILRTEKRLQKRRIAKRNRAHARRALSDVAPESAWDDQEIPRWQRVGEIHVGRNAPRRPRDEGRAVT
jgi:hypothetical protein